MAIRKRDVQLRIGSPRQAQRVLAEGVAEFRLAMSRSPETSHPSACGMP